MGEATHALLLTFDDDLICTVCYEGEEAASAAPSLLRAITRTVRRPLPFACPRCGRDANGAAAVAAAERIAAADR